MTVPSFLNIILFAALFCQMKNLYGTDSEFKSGLHAGNQFRTSFFNDGTYGAVGNAYQSGIYIGEWPINSSHYYLRDGNIFVGAEVKIGDNLVHIFSENKSANIGKTAHQKRAFFVPKNLIIVTGKFPIISGGR